MGDEKLRCVVLAERHHGLMERIRGMLETTFETVVMVADEASLLESASRLSAALAVVDFSLTRGNGIGMIKRLHAHCPEMKMIVISVLDEPSVSKSALAAGTNGFVLKRVLATDLLPAVDAVLAGQCYVSPGGFARSGRRVKNNGRRHTSESKLCGRANEASCGSAP